MLNRWNLIIPTSIVAAVLAIAVALAAPSDRNGTDTSASQSAQAQPAGFGQALKQIREGRDIFRYQTFGDEAFWGDTLRLHGIYNVPEGHHEIDHAMAIAIAYINPS